MGHSVIFDLELNRKRLNYYAQLKEKNASVGKKAPAVDKWLEIYAERVQKLERQATKLGLKTQLANATALRAASA